MFESRYRTLCPSMASLASLIPIIFDSNNIWSCFLTCNELGKYVSRLLSKFIADWYTRMLLILDVIVPLSKAVFNKGKKLQKNAHMLETTRRIPRSTWRIEHKGTSFIVDADRTYEPPR